MSVLFIPFMDIRGQSPRWRAFWPAKALGMAGVETRCIPWQRCRRTDIEWATVTVFERPANALVRPWWRDGPWWGALRRRRLQSLWDAAKARGSVGYELDDLVFVPGHERGRADVTQWQIEHLRRADFLLTSTETLRGHLLEFHERVFTLPNCLDTEGFTPPPGGTDRSPLRVGWACGATHGEDEPLFLLIAEALAKRLGDSIELLLWGRPSEAVMRALRCLPSPSRLLPLCLWSEVPRRLAEFDINLIPLADTPLNACKSAVHWIEAAALGIPSVASPTGEFPEVIRDGESGFLARHPEEWAEHVATLIESPERRRRMGDTARAEVLAKRTLSQQGPMLRAILASVGGSGARSASQ
ncbi:glycosyltransferase [Candidatus Sumerlaeota bacterium]|nr:glycosyltransferase [Candidatus Sumerlaeota bacterium]